MLGTFEEKRFKAWSCDDGSHMMVSARRGLVLEDERPYTSLRGKVDVGCTSFTRSCNSVHEDMCSVSYLVL